MNIPSAKPGFNKEDVNLILAEIEEILKSGKLTQGQKQTEFEQRFAAYVGTKHAIAVNSGTCSLEIILRYYDVKDKEVVVPTNSFVASANSVLLSGGTPVLADIKADTLCLDPESVKQKLSPKTKAVMVVHLAGLPCPQMEELISLCKEKKLILIEDAAQAHGAVWRKQKVGSIGRAGSFSFYSTKVMTTGEGGMITTDDAGLADYARSMRNHGFENGRAVRLGYNWRMSEIQAVLGIHQLNRIKEFVERRNAIADKYKELLGESGQFHYINVPADIRHSYYKFPVIFKDDIDTTEFAKRMRDDHGVFLAPLYYPPIHLQPFYQSLGCKQGMLPVAEKILKQQLCLPMFTGLSDEDLKVVAAAFQKVLKGARGR